MPNVNPHAFKSPEWYEWIHNEAEVPHQVFIDWLRPRMADIHSVMEIGCGKHWFYDDFFGDKIYFGVDHDPKVIQHCLHRGRPHHGWFCTDFQHAEFTERADLIFSRATIDHVADPDGFLRKAVEQARKYAYIMTYRGYFPALPAHRQEHSEVDGYWYTDLSNFRLQALLSGLGVKYDLKRVPTGRAEGEIQEELHIVVEKP